MTPATPTPPPAPSPDRGAGHVGAHECTHCSNGYFDGSETECVNGVLIDIDEAHEGWQPDVGYPPAPCMRCEVCRGLSWTGEAKCALCNSTGWQGGYDRSQELLVSWATTPEPLP